MGRIPVLKVFLALVLWTSAGALARQYEPRFFTLDRRALTVAKQEAVFEFSFEDQKERHTMFLLSDGAGRPQLFFADITIPVCLDEVCNPVRIELYWDLAGDYAGYGVVPGFPLEKYDAIPFEPADYAKLHQVLSDRNSLLGKQPLRELVDPAARPVTTDAAGKEAAVDAVSGATIGEIQGSIVRGALYSCHVLWNLAHGEDVRARMRRHVHSIFNPDLARRFLNTDSPGYQACALVEMDAELLNECLPRILELFEKSGFTVRSRILERLPEKILREERVTRALYLPFGQMDAGTKAALIESLERAGPSAAGILAERIESMTRAQLLGYLAYFSKDPARLSDAIRSRLWRIAAAERYAYCYVIGDFLHDLPGNRPE